MASEAAKDAVAIKAIALEIYEVLFVAIAKVLKTANKLSFALLKETRAFQGDIKELFEFYSISRYPFETYSISLTIRIIYGASRC